MMLLYLILQAETSASLEEVVEAYLKDGWSLVGGVCCVRREPPGYPPAFRYLQAVWKEDTHDMDSD